MRTLRRLPYATAVFFATILARWKKFFITAAIIAAVQWFRGVW
jgi:hypothetical protein